MVVKITHANSITTNSDGSKTKRIATSELIQVIINKHEVKNNRFTNEDNAPPVAELAPCDNYA